MAKSKGSFQWQSIVVTRPIRAYEFSPLPCHAPLLCPKFHVAEDETLAGCRPADRLSTRLRTSRHRQTIAYLSLCIWHIVKLIERGDKIAMFLTLSELRVFSRETERDGEKERSYLRGRNGQRQRAGKERKRDTEARVCVRNRVLVDRTASGASRICAAVGEQPRGTLSGAGPPVYISFRSFFLSFFLSSFLPFFLSFLLSFSFSL